MKITPELTGALLIGWTLLYVAGLLGLEWLTLRDTIPSNHITAVIRSAWEKQSWAFLPFIAAMAYLAGHFFASAKETKIEVVVKDETENTPPDTLG